MKDKNGIEIDCDNCAHYEYCDDKFYLGTGTTADSCGFEPSSQACEVRIAELQELCFTDEELDLIRKYLQEQIWEYKDGWSAVKKIIAKCNELLKKRNK